MEKNVTIKYKLGHSYNFTYEKSELYCPNCGIQEVWNEQGAGDYYEGVTHVCVGCNAVFTIPTLTDPSPEYKQVIEQIKKV